MNLEHPEQFSEAFRDDASGRAGLHAVLAAIPGVNRLLAADAPRFTFDR